MRSRLIVGISFILITIITISSIPLQAQGQDDDWDLHELLELAAQDINDYWVAVLLKITCTTPNKKLSQN